VQQQQPTSTSWHHPPAQRRKHWLGQAAQQQQQQTWHQQQQGQEEGEEWDRQEEAQGKRQRARRVWMEAVLVATCGRVAGMRMTTRTVSEMGCAGMLLCGWVGAVEVCLH
jgi:hypothetical protein